MDNKYTLVPYIFHPKIILRNPRMPMSFLLKDEESIFKLLDDEAFLESIYISSPVVYSECLKFLNQALPVNKRDKLKKTILKYYLRSISRSTPFGLHAGCSVISWGNIQQRIVIDEKQVKRFVRLNVQYLFDLIKIISNIETVSNKLIYFSNTSLYKISDSYRYVEYSYKNNIRNYYVSEIENSNELETILKLAKNGCKIKDIYNYLASDYSLSESIKFVNELITSQILICELEPKLTGEDNLLILLKFLDNFKNTSDKYLERCNKVLKAVKESFYKISNLDIDFIKIYQEIILLLKELEVPFDDTKIIQIDLKNNVKIGNIDKKFQSQLSDALTVLNKLSTSSKNTYLNNFKERFKNRYGAREMPLLHVLDPEYGIGNIGMKESSTSPILDGLINNQFKRDPSINWGKKEEILNKKIIGNTGNTEIEINEIDLEERWENTPPSMSMLFKVIDFNKDILQITSVGGSTAASLLGRFAYISCEIEKIIKEIYRWECDLDSERIIAEIVHHPQNPSSNVMQRQATRPFELPYLAQPSVSEKSIIDVNDLFISVNSGLITLRSYKNNKIVVPRLSNADNYLNSDLPVYRFLCELQNQEFQSSLNFSWGDLTKIYKKFPRVTYKKIILSPACWFLTNEDIIKHFPTGIPINKQNINLIIEKYCFPNEILFCEGDNELLIDLSNTTSVITFLELIKNKNIFLLKEFIKPSEGFIYDTKNYSYAHELVCPLLKKTIPQNINKEKEFSKAKDSTISVIRDFIIGSEWCYLKIYCGEQTSDKILFQVIKPIINKLSLLGVIDVWFFIRDYDSEPHIRLRIHVIKINEFGNIMTIINHHFTPFIKSGLIWDLQAHTYSREIEKYGTASIIYAEKFFFLFSDLFTKLLDEHNGDLPEEERWINALLTIDCILNSIYFDITKKISIINFIRDSYLEEQTQDKEIFAKLNNLYRKFKSKIWDSFNQNKLFHGSKSFNSYGESFEQELKSTAKDMIYNFNKNETEISFDYFMKRIIHISINCFINSKQRVNEMVICHFLLLFYRSLEKKNVQFKNIIL